MKDVKLLVFLTQLGLSVVIPLGGFILLAVWLYRARGWGGWVIAVGVILGIVCAIDGVRGLIKAAQRMESKSQEPPFEAFNDHE